MSKVGIILAYPLQHQIDVGHIDNLKDMYQNLLKMFDEVHVFSPRDSKKYKLGKNIYVHTLNHKGPRPFSLFLDGLRINYLLHKHKINVVRSLDTVSGFTGFIATSGTPVPHIVSLHRDRTLVHQQQQRGYSKFYIWLMDVAEKLILKHASLVPAISNYIKKIAIRQGASEKKIFMHPNFVDTKIFKQLKIKRKDQILYIGRLDKVKKIDLGIKAFEKVLKKNPKLKFVIAGDGPEKKNLEKLAKGLNVKFLGSVKHNNCAKLYSESKLFLSPSLSGYTLIESLFCGLPIVAVDLEWTKEIVKNKINGIVTKQNADSLSNAIITILDNYKHYEKNASKKGLKKFTKENWQKRELQIYKKVLNQK